MREFLEESKLKQISYKYVSIDDFLISLDRLTRFKHPSEKYYRVFKDILFKYLITPKYSKKQLEELDPKIVSYLVQKIWNESVKSLGYSVKLKDKIMKTMNLLDNSCYRGYDTNTKVLMKTKLAIEPLLGLFESNYKELPDNVKLLVKLKDFFNNNQEENILELSKKIRESNKIKYPITKLVLTEGITEEILLPEFSKQEKYDFQAHGIYVLGAGGKSKIPNLYSKLRKTVKIPILILLDNDANEIYNIVKKTLLKKDNIILINKGEFEDIVSKSLIKRSINNAYYDLEQVTITELCISDSMCENIKTIYKTRKIGEFQKAHFAKILAQNIKYKSDVSPEIAAIIEAIKSI